MNFSLFGRLSVVLVAVLSSVVCGATYAADTEPYFGLKGGFLTSDSSGFGDALNIGGFAGANVVDLRGHSIPGTISVEGELTLPLVKGDVNSTFPGSGNFVGKWNAWTLGGFGVYRGLESNNFYFKGKAGFVHSNTTVSAPGFPGNSGAGSSTDFAFGVGGGYRFNRRNSIEVEVTIMDRLTFMSAGYTF
ncbi:MAG: outer membrane beta-barrel protein [Burkholderiales bacterium]